MTLWKEHKQNYDKETLSRFVKSYFRLVVKPCHQVYSSEFAQSPINCRRHECDRGAGWLKLKY